MKKHEAVEIFGKTQTELARALGCSKQLITMWPETLTARQRDWVLGAAIRLGKRIPTDVRAELSEDRVA